MKVSKSLIEACESLFSEGEIHNATFYETYALVEVKEEKLNGITDDELLELHTKKMLEKKAEVSVDVKLQSITEYVDGTIYFFKVNCKE